MTTFKRLASVAALTALMAITGAWSPNRPSGDIPTSASSAANPNLSGQDATARTINLQGVGGELKFGANTVLETDGSSCYASPANDTTGSLYWYTGGAQRGQVSSTGAWTLNGNVAIGNILTVSGRGLTTAGVAASQIVLGSPIKPVTYHYDDFLWSPLPASYTMVATLGGTVTQVASLGGSPDPNGLGAGFAVVGTPVGTSPPVSVNYHYGYNALLGQFTAFRGKVGFMVTTLSDPNESYALSVGSLQNVSALAAPNRVSVAIRYAHDANSGKFQIATGGNGGTLTDSGVTVVANQAYIFEWVVSQVNANGLNTSPVSWALYDGFTNATLASGSGTCSLGNTGGSGHNVAPLGVEIVKLIGTASRTVHIDFWEWAGQKR